MNITFIGAANTVTGSSYLIETNNTKILIDFGLYQEENSNNEELNFDPKEIDFIILTHAHIDHVGRIPLLFKNGFKGKVYCTYQTKDLAEIMLKDSATIQNRKTELENEKKIKAGLEPIEPLYNMTDVENTISYLYPIKFNEEEKNKNIKFEFFKAGHILGAASILLTINEDNVYKKICFSGDLGNNGNLLLSPAEFKGYCDYLIMESTYGNRIHDNIIKRKDKLASILLDIYNNKEIGIIPSFSLGRTQNLIIELKNLINEEQYKILENLPIYIDSPLGLKATDIYSNNKFMLKEDLKNSKNIFDMKNIHFLEELKETFRVIKTNEPKLIISSSGMCNGGKILFYLREYLDNPKTNIIFIGYQAENTLGRRILEKENPVWISKKDYKVNAKIHKINGYSAHADQNDLISFVTDLNHKPDMIFITHGEEKSRKVLKEKLIDNDLKNIFLPNKNQSFKL